MHQDRIASGGASGEGSQGLVSGLNNVAGQPHLQEVTGLVLKIAKSWIKKNVILSSISNAN